MEQKRAICKLVMNWIKIVRTWGRCPILFCGDLIMALLTLKFKSYEHFYSKLQLYYVQTAIKHARFIDVWK